MEITYHAIFSFVLAAILFPFIGLNALIVFLAGSLMDFDHYIWHSLRFKTLSIKRAYVFCENYNKHSRIKGVFDFMHFIEFYVIFFLLGFYYEFFWYITIGGLFHIIIDYIEMRLHKDTKFRLFSLVRWIKMNCK